MDNPFGYWFGVFTGAATIGVPWLLSRLVDAIVKRAAWKAETDIRLRNLEDRLDRLEGRAKRPREGEL